MQVFYVNIGGGEPTVRPDFWELLDYAVAHHVGVKFSTNGFRITTERAERLAATDYVDVQISLDGATAEVNDAVRGEGTYDAALRAMANLQAAGMRDFKLSVVCTRHNIGQLDEFKAIADSVRRPAAADPAAPVGPRRRRLGRPAPAAATSSASSTTGWSPTATRCSPATRSSTCRPTARRWKCAAGAQPVRRRPGGLPGRPGRRRVRMPVRHPRPVPGRQPARGRRLRHDLEDRAAVPRPALAPDRGRVHPVLGVRLVPRRLHGRQVLHRSAARRPGPGVREGQRRDRAGRRRASDPAPRRTTRTRGRSGTHRCR